MGEQALLTGLLYGGGIIIAAVVYVKVLARFIFG